MLNISTRTGFSTKYFNVQHDFCSKFLFWNKKVFRFSYNRLPNRRFEEKYKHKLQIYGLFFLNMRVLVNPECGGTGGTGDTYRYIH